MKKRWIGVAGSVLAVGAALLVSPRAFSQMGDKQPVVYTFVSQFQVPRASWAQYAENTEKNFIPIADKLVADGTILGYSTFETIVHTPDGYTNGAAWTSSSIAGLMKLLEEVRKAGPQPGQIAATKHEDYLMQTSTYVMGSVKPEYLRVVCQNGKADKPAELNAAIKKYIWPMAEEAAKSGVVSYVGLDSQYVNTSAPSERCLVITFPNADSIDKWAVLVNANFAKMNAGQTVEFYGAQQPDSRRDMMARITHSGGGRK